MTALRSPLVFLLLLFGALSLEEDVYAERDETLYPTNSLISPGALFPVGGTLPTSRVHHSIVSVLDYIVVYGGYGVDGSRLDDINLFYSVNQRWSGPVFRKQCCNDDKETIETMGFEEGDTLELPFIRTSFQGDIPLARAEHAAVAIDTKMYLFGGVTDDFGYVQDLYSFDVNELKWHLLSTESKDVPCRRAGHSMTTDGTTYVYVFGGRSSLMSNNRNFGLNDIWRYNILSNTWTNLYPTINNLLTTNKDNSNIPPVRQFASLAYINDKIYLFGGINPVSNLTYNDVWMFHPGIKTWTRLFIQGNAQTAGWIPPPMYHAHLLPVPLDSYYNSNNTEVTGFIVYGGVGGGGFCGGSACDQQQTVLGQSFLFEFTRNNWRADRSATGEANTEVIFDTENGYVNATKWSYARLSAFVTASEPAIGTSIELNHRVMSDTSGTSAVLSRGSDEGKYIKSYALEKVVYVQKRKLFYEFGGLQYTGSSYSTILQQTLDTAGGVLTDPLWDLSTGEQLRDAVNLPTNPTWTYSDAFVTEAGKKNSVSFVRSFRTFLTTLKDIVLIKEDSIL